MPCPYLQFRDAADGLAFDHERPYCDVVERFVQPVRADVCQERYDLDPAAHCEYYSDREGLDGTRDDLDGPPVDLDSRGAGSRR